MRRIALVTQDLALEGGVGTMTAFLHKVLKGTGRYEPSVISLATAASDSASARIRSPGTWRRGPTTRSVEWRGMKATHVGAWAVELEFQRYLPRRILTDLLGEFDLIQFVVGNASWVHAASGVGRPTLVWTATTVRADRASRTRSESAGRRSWSHLMTRAVERIESRAINEASVVFALSDYTISSIQPMVARPVILAPCGVDTDLFKPAELPGRNYILCTARLSDARKNVRLLLSAYASLQNRVASMPDLHLVGELPNPESMKLLASLGIGGKVHLLGPKSPAELVPLYQNALFFVLSSDEEGLGIVLLEAMASGLPAISTACGGPETAVAHEQTGLLTPVGDRDALAEAMFRLISQQDLCREMGRAARRAAEQRFSLRSTGGVFLEQYDRLLAEPAGEVQRS